MNTFTSTYIVAPDSFKGSLSAREVAAAIKRGILSYEPEAQVLEIPIADGGEGTLDAIVPAKDRISMAVCGTDRRVIKAEYGFVGDTAIIEMAVAAGLCIVPEGERDPERATTFGVGQLITNALDRGFRRIMITVGGSGTNDGGSGMIEALGARFYAENGELLSMCGGALAKVARIDLAGLDKRLFETKFTFACDVTNPLVGEKGATYIYGAQKGADAAMLERLEAGMKNYAARLADACGKDISDHPGCGAGGGLASPLVAICGAEIRSGISSVLSTLDFDKKIEGAKLIITGEGKIDLQSAFGKAISGVTDAAKKQNIPVIALVGAKGEGADQLVNFGILRVEATKDIAPSAEYSMKHADVLLEKLAASVLEELKI